MVTAVLITAFSSLAQSQEEVAALQKQLNELSAKIAQLEQNNAAQIAQFQKDSDAKAWSIEQLQAEGKKDEAASWANDIKIKGDFRYRYENVARDGEADNSRQRVRLRIGAFGKVNDFADFGVRIATGNGSETSANQTLAVSDGGGDDDTYFDMMYADLHPEQLKGAHLFMGKMPQPWLDRTGLIWDSDLNPEGLAATYESTLSGGLKVMANAGTFVIEENRGDDIQLWSGQVAGETKIKEAKVRMGISDFFFENADTQALGTGANTPGTDFYLIEGFGTIGMTLGLPLALNGQYVVNVDAEDSDEDTAYLVGITVGKAKDKGTWEVGYNWRDTGDDAVPDGFNDSDFANGAAGSHGHSLGAKYQIAKNLQAGLTYLMAEDNTGKDVDTFHADLNFKF
jgi:hypothetical protein